MKSNIIFTAVFAALVVLAFAFAPKAGAAEFPPVHEAAMVGIDPTALPPTVYGDEQLYSYCGWVCIIPEEDGACLGDPEEKFFCGYSWISSGAAQRNFWTKVNNYGCYLGLAPCP